MQYIPKVQNQRAFLKSLYSLAARVGSGEILRLR